MYFFPKTKQAIIPDLFKKHCNQLTRMLKSFFFLFFSSFTQHATIWALKCDLSKQSLGLEQSAESVLLSREWAGPWLRAPPLSRCCSILEQLCDFMNEGRSPLLPLCLHSAALTVEHCRDTRLNEAFSIYTLIMALLHLSCI